MGMAKVFNVLFKQYVFLILVPDGLAKEEGESSENSWRCLISRKSYIISQGEL